VRVSWIRRDPYSYFGIPYKGHRNGSRLRVSEATRTQATASNTRQRWSTRASPATAAHLLLRQSLHRLPMTANLPGALLGAFERTLFFVAILANSPEVIVGWLAFKVASKWEVWSSLVQVSKAMPGTSEVLYLRARHQWGSFILMRFLTGTIAKHPHRLRIGLRRQWIIKSSKAKVTARPPASA